MGNPKTHADSSQPLAQSIKTDANSLPDARAASFSVPLVDAARTASASAKKMVLLTVKSRHNENAVAIVAQRS